MSRKGENIYKRKDGRWEGRYIKGHDIDHKAKYGYVYAKTYSEVKSKLRNKISEMYNDDGSKNGHTLRYYSGQWLNSTKNRIKYSSYIKYHNILKNHIIPEFGDRMIKDIDRTAIKKFVQRKITNENSNGKEGLSEKTIKDILSVLRLVILYASETEDEIAYDLYPFKIKAQRSEVKCLSKESQAKLIYCLTEELCNVSLGILICLYTGLRIGEICALKFNDISENVIHVNKTLQRVQNIEKDSPRKTKIIITEPKSFCSRREIPVPDILSKAIKDLYVDNAYVLTGLKDKFMEPRTLQNKFKKYIKKCGIDDINFHAIRHTFATRCVESGFEIKCLSEILGHANVNITLNKYVHSSIELKKLNMNKLELYSPSKNPSNP